MDCLDGMKHIPDKSVDMILCDLPYGTTQNKWDVKINLCGLWQQYKRICRGAIVLFAQTPFDKVLGASNIENLKYEWIWIKENSTGFLNAKKSPLKKHENILIFYEKQPTYNPQFRVGEPYKAKQGTKSTNYGDVNPGYFTVNTGVRYPNSILEFSRDKNKLHPTQKPVALFEYLIKTYTNEGNAVLDNCMGSGTTAIACLNTNRNYIGFETDQKYFDVSQERIKKHLETL
jgi:site-specific DNA-methyltransferase (adenine-specific)